MNSLLYDFSDFFYALPIPEEVFAVLHLLFYAGLFLVPAVVHKEIKAEDSLISILFEGSEDPLILFENTQSIRKNAAADLLFARSGIALSEQLSGNKRPEFVRLTDENGQKSLYKLSSRHFSSEGKTYELIRLQAREETPFSAEILNILPVCLLQIDTFGTIVSAAGNTEEFFETGPEEVCGRKIQNKYLQPTDSYGRQAEPALHPVFRVLNGNEIKAEQEMRILTPSGQVKYLKMRCRALFSANSEQLSGAELCLSDITEKISSRLELNESIKQLDEFQRISQIGYWQYNLHSNSYFFTEQIIELVENENVNRTGDGNRTDLLRLFSSASREKILTGIKHLMKTGESFDLQVELTTFKKKKKIIRIAGHAVEHDDLILEIRGTVRDITDQIRKEQELKSREKLFSEMFYSHSAVMLLIDSDRGGEILDSNRAAEVFYGRTKEKLNTLKISDINILQAEKIEKKMQAATSGKQSSFRFKHRVAGGKISDVEVYSTPMTHNGRTILFSVIHDITERSLAEKALRASERNLKSVIENTPICIWSTDSDLKLRIWSPPAEEIIREFSGQIVTGGMRVHIPADFGEIEGQLLQMKTDALAGKPSKSEVSIRIGGKLKTYFAQFTNLTDEKGQNNGVLVSMHDITQEYAARREVREVLSEREIILKNVDVGIVLVRGQNFVWMNESMEKMFGYTIREISEQSTSVLYPSRADFEEVGLAYKSVREGETFRAEKKMRRKDGRLFWCSLIGKAHQSEETENSAIWIIEDIDKRRNSAQKLAESEEKFRQLAENIEQVLWLHIPGQIIYMSPAGQQVFGCPAEQFYERKDLFAELALEEDRQKVRDIFRKCKEERTNQEIEYRFRRRSDGIVRWVNMRIFPLSNSENEPRFVGIAADVTAEKINRIQIEETNRNLEETKRRLERTLEKEVTGKKVLQQTYDKLKSAQMQLVQAEKMSSLGQLTAGIAHEINNPINFVYAGSDILTESISELGSLLTLYDKTDRAVPEELPALMAEIKHLKQELDYENLKENIFNVVRDIRVGASRTAEIVQGLRTFSRLDEDVPKFVDLHENLDVTLLMLKKQFPEHILIIKNYAEDLPRIECFPGKINQVFMNLIANALHAVENENAGTVTITTSCHNAEEEIENQYVTISVKDTGHGMSELTRNRVFEPFFTTKAVGKGTGLGLPISLGIVERHAGKIDVKSEIGQGSEFIVRLPVVSPFTDADTGIGM